MHYLKITASFLLTVHAFHLASLQESTDSPRQTLDQDWLRVFLQNTAERQNTTEQEAQYYSGSDTGEESSIDYVGTASGSMAVNYLEEENVLRHETAGNNGSDVVNTTLSSTVSSNTTKLPELSNTTVTITTTATTKQSPVNMTETEEESSGSATTSQTSTTPKSTASSTQTSTTKSMGDLNSSTTTPSTTTPSTTTPSTTTPRTTTPSTTTPSTTTPSTTTPRTTTVTTTAKPMIEETSNTHSTTTTLSPETTGLIPETTTSATFNTPEKVNRTALGDDEEREFASDVRSSKSNRAWAAVLGTGVAVTCVGLVAYIILKKKRQRDFSHRKLVEEFHPDPVLRLDNSEPLDLNFGGGAYYNPALERDNIQMSNFSGHRR
ncbi:mucin-15 [Solea solea]|uniref:mucin-15 n=1 Tax=Solea solea TaxID=90069 RepID=UPI00272BDB45|nr:mucin-15 [Solea solea]